MTKSSTATIDQPEAAHFGSLAQDWWNPSGSSAMLHKLNPVRLGFIRAGIDAHWGGNAKALKPLAGKRALDVGCGAGLVCEPLARLGATVTGVDAAPENIEVAKAHAKACGLAIDYFAGELEQYRHPCESGDPSDTKHERSDMDSRFRANDEGFGFKLITALEVIEHVSDPAAFIAQIAVRLAPDGLLILSTPNRTAQSRFGLVTLAEGLGLIPKHTHDWNKFLKPDELTALLSAAGLKVIETRGIAFSITRGLHLSDDLTLNYIMSAVRSPSAAFWP